MSKKIICVSKNNINKIKNTNPGQQNIDSIKEFMSRINMKTEINFIETKVNPNDVKPIANIIPGVGREVPKFSSTKGYGEAIDNLIKSVDVFGVLIKPFVVTINNQLYALDGYSRCLSASIAGLKEIDVYLLDNISEDDIIRLSYNLNAVRREMSFKEKSNYMNYFYKKYKEQFPNVKNRDIYLLLADYFCIGGYNEKSKIDTVRKYLVTSEFYLEHGDKIEEELTHNEVARIVSAARAYSKKHGVDKIDVEEEIIEKAKEKNMKPDELAKAVKLEVTKLDSDLPIEKIAEIYSEESGTIVADDLIVTITIPRDIAQGLTNFADEKHEGVLTPAINFILREYLQVNGYLKGDAE